MKLNHCKNRYYLIFTAVACLLAGSFFAGMGLQKIVGSQKLRKEYATSELQWKQELAEGEDAAIVRDLRNQELVENMKYVSLERQIYFDYADAFGEARIANGSENKFSCTVRIVRDATGEVVYESDLLEPGYYIEKIRLAGGLKQGFYPCTAVWDFYTQGEEYAGETAWNVVVIIKSAN
ncbi:hypothetical protein [Lacrimispora indolis]|uniref:hypothetical protein n=1 Tax=Lacrimispora indolis TaxID=69825 RepID=UPI00042758F7|nr:MULTISPECIES: hypothetical protein [Lachnospiraceae]MBE7718094.1 hypothetical protein [Lacrimispora celerecrescens]